MARVLVVEDDPDVREMLAVMLRAADHEVIPSENGHVAVRLVLALTELPDVVVSDLRMPKMDGLALVTELRGYPRSETIPFLLLTAVPHDERVRKVLSFPRTAMRSKPISARQLRLAIAELLAAN